jgi:uncharacterized alpha-E superfamily protein
VLARVVENVYWLARYLERAENTARLVGVNTNLVLDLPRGLTPGWQPLIDITGSRELFDARAGRADERDIVQFLLADADNPGSIASSFRMVRENARTLRDILPTESWELMNQFYLEFIEELPTGLNKRTRFNFLKRLVLNSQTLTGSLEGTMNRSDAYTFLLLGRHVERADMTSRIIDVRSAQLLPEDAPELRPFDTIQWMSVLKSLSGYEMYRLSRRTRVSRTGVLEFVLRGEQFPRACGFSLRPIEQCLLGLPRSAGVLDALAGAIRFLGQVDVKSLDQRGLHELIDRLQVHIIDVHDGIAQTYFPSRGGASTGQKQSQSSEPSSKTLPLFAETDTPS